ncbi:YebC/PmpR family DNA-binding transcriptional regulator [Alphaproteobacteria bacterium]|jgi:YebC/PmpR family DNA-binding regulatory protein|nr:YebC/PmpR family DNA-binding transcriptional regulator [Alphaproteobacteria bacterium]
MAGHSKFKNIQHRKGAQDKKRAKIFTRLIKELSVAARSSTDPASNPRLRGALSAARAANMPKDNIERVLKRAEGGEGDAYEEIRYEGYGPGGVAFIVEAMTDNRNRTASEVRSFFSKFGGALAETGSVSFMFDKVGQIVYPLAVADAETMFEAALEAGADNVETEEDSHIITTAAEEFNAVRENIEKQFDAPEEAALIWQPQNSIAVEEANASTLLKLYDALDENDDVQSVFANFEISDEIMTKLDG